MEANMRNWVKMLWLWNFFTLLCQSEVKRSIHFFKGWRCQCYSLEMLLGYNAKYPMDTKGFEPMILMFPNMSILSAMWTKHTNDISWTHRHFTESCRLCPDIWMVGLNGHCSYLRPQEVGRAKCMTLFKSALSQLDFLLKWVMIATLYFNNHTHKLDSVVEHIKEKKMWTLGFLNLGWEFVKFVLVITLVSSGQPGSRIFEQNRKQPMRYDFVVLFDWAEDSAGMSILLNHNVPLWDPRMKSTCATRGAFA